MIGNEDEGGRSNGPSPSATESSCIDKMFTERKQYERICQVPEE